MSGEQVTGLDRWAVTELLSRYAHVVDNQAWEELPSVFTDDAHLTEASTAVVGLDGIRGYLESFDPKRSHHTLNTITTISDEGTSARAWSRFVIIEFDATSLTGDYLDEIVLSAAGPRITQRSISVRNRPDIAAEPVSFATWAGTA
ncbi:nuclear transport factor 2 family protein [Nocardia sp. 348MFTsu5.1]|uniref:nuclear transport factor 2 family protein n=1 Tax=Nocardia sp. 348MFTsu5.1 TaxID=1172185 RepID=UPI00037A3634|nr:nuclear transport factor 2 family protein [Nocardia sp. 348MFTsu5.1]